MASLGWDLFEQPSSANRTRLRAQSGRSDDDNVSDDEDNGPQMEAEEEVVHEENMFELSPSILPIDNANIKQLCVENDVKVILTEDRQVCVSGDAVKYIVYDIPVIRADDDVHKIFLCPRGVHCIVTTKSGDNFYICTKDPPPTAKDSRAKPKRCDKLRDYCIDSVGWKKNNTSDITSGPILLGTSKGLIVETKLEKDGAKSSKTVYDLYEVRPIIGLEVDSFPRSKSHKMLVLVATACRIYQFIGGPTFDLLFGDYETPSFIELAACELSELRLWHSTAGVPKVFAWITGAGIMHGRLLFTNSHLKPHKYNDKDDQQQDATAALHLLQHNNSNNNNFQDEPSEETVMNKESHIIPQFEGMPISFAISEFHFYIAYKDKLVVLGHPPGLNWASTSEPFQKLKPQDIESRIEFKELFNPEKKSTKLIGIVKDNVTSTVYVYTMRNIYEINTTDEKRNVWQQFLERAMDPKERESEAYFNRSLKLCKNDEAKRDRVLQAKADYHFSIGQYDQAAKVFSRTNRSFEETALKFIEIGERDPLLKFLLYRIEFMKERRTNENQEKKQMCCLCTWVVEIYLDKLNSLFEDSSSSSSSSSSYSSSYSSSTRSSNASIRSEVSHDFKNFLVEQKAYLDKVTTINLISSHGQSEEVLYFAELMEDYERVITHHIISAQDYAAAMAVLSTHCQSAKYADLWHKFSPTLIQHHPDKLVQGWMMEQPSKFIVPSKLIPALVKYNASEHNPSGVNQNQAIKYLEWLVYKKKNTDAAMHNMLLSFYVLQSDESSLLSFLQTTTCYDQKYALRLCLEAGKTLACVHIYSQMGLFEDAVRTALKIKDVKLAKINADKPDEDDLQLKKKLWLEIAKFVVRGQGQGDVSKAIQMLKETQCIKLEDILPFFPDFVLIQEFKSEICQSLEDYNAQIENLKKEMDEATNNADAIRTSIKDLRHRYGYITATQPCDLCSLPALSRSVFLFPSCRHVFHQSCLIEHVKANLSEFTKKRVTELEILLEKSQQQQLSQPNNNNNNNDINAPEDSTFQKYRKELDSILTSECIFCSDHMIRTIDKTFVENFDDYSADMSWAI